MTYPTEKNEPKMKEHWKKGQDSKQRLDIHNIMVPCSRRAEGNPSIIVSDETTMVSGDRFIIPAVSAQNILLNHLHD
jgi:hypothetical protein